jgi:hypothetical protein
VVTRVLLRRISAQHGKNEHALKLGRKGQKIDLHKESAPKKIECENAAYRGNKATSRGSLYQSVFCAYE